VSGGPGVVTYRERSSTSLIVIHDSHGTPPSDPAGAAGAGAQWLLVQGRQRGLLSVGYHFIVGRDGGLVACRPVGSVGSHAPGHNHRSVGVCLIGGASGASDFTHMQMLTTRILLADLVERYSLELPAIVGHSELYRSRPGSTRRARCPSLDVAALRQDTYAELDYRKTGTTQA
jgi:N-acetylmuramoyl-L-alanine amidase